MYCELLYHYWLFSWRKVLVQHDWKHFTSFQALSNIFSEVTGKKEEQLIIFVYTSGPQRLLFLARERPEACIYTMGLFEWKFMSLFTQTETTGPISDWIWMSKGCSTWKWKITRNTAKHLYKFRKKIHKLKIGLLWSWAYLQGEVCTQHTEKHTAWQYAPVPDLPRLSPFPHTCHNLSQESLSPYQLNALTYNKSSQQSQVKAAASHVFLWDLLLDNWKPKMGKERCPEGTQGVLVEVFIY